VAEPVRRAVSRLADEGDFGYAQRTGDEGLEAAFGRRMRDRFGWEADPERVVPVADLVQAIIAAVLAFSEPGDGVVVQTPIYPPFLGAVEATERRLRCSPLVDEGSRLVVDPAELERAVDGTTRLLLLCNPHNPSGRAFSRTELEAIAALAVAHDLVVVADEVHCDLVYPGARHLPLAALGSEIAARTVTINSATKSFNIPGLRCGVMHFGSGDLLDRFRRAHPGRLLGAVNIVGVDATVAAWRECQPWLDAVMEVLAGNREQVAAWAAGHAAAIAHHPPEATFLAWLDCRAMSIPSSPRDFFLERARVGLHAGEDFGPGGEGCVRLNFATSPEILGELLERMGEAIADAG
jgi:cystathionine beta-lyase